MSDLNPVIKKTILVNHPELGNIEVRVEGVVTERSGVADFKVYYQYTDVTRELPAEVTMQCLDALNK